MYVVILVLVDNPPMADICVCAERQGIVTFCPLAGTHNEGSLPANTRDKEFIVSVLVSELSRHARM